MKLTKEQLEALAPYEQHFETAVRSRWARYPGTDAMRLIHRIYCDVTGAKIRLNTSCGVCRLNLLRGLGKIYFEDKAELEAAAAAEAAKAAEAPVEEAPKPKAKKTTKKAKQ